MSRRATMPATRPGTVDPLVHIVPATVTGGEVQLVVRLAVDSDGDGSPADRHPLVRTVSADVGPDELGAPADGLDLVGVCADLTRSIGDDDLAEAMSVVATVAGCPAVLLRPDRSVLAAGEPRAARRTGVAISPPHRWRWPANGPRADREIAVCAGTRRLGIVAFQHPVPCHPGPVWEIVHDLLALALLGRETLRRAEAAELQAALLACLSDEDTASPRRESARQVGYRPAVISAVTDAPWTPDMFARLHLRIGEHPLLAAGRCVRSEDRIVCLYPHPEESDPREHAVAWQHVLDAVAPLRFRAAIGMPAVRGAGLKDSYRTTRWLAELQAVRTAGVTVDDIAVVDELGIVAGTLGPGWGPRLGHFIRRVLGDLVDNPRFGGEMLDTLHAYLVSGGSPAEAARLLHLSPSSMKYRMRIIRASLGDRLHDHDSVFEIELALRLLKAVRGRGTRSDDDPAPKDLAAVRLDVV